jgi:cell wall-associated NlpC family hydrolase
MAVDSRVIPVSVLLAGAYLSWFGVHYWRSDTKWPSDPVKAALQGKPQPPNTVTTDTGPLTQLAQSIGQHAQALAAQQQAQQQGSSSSSTFDIHSRVASDALKYQGAGYAWGGNASSIGNWDCSSFVSYVLGHDLGLPLPGGHWGAPGFPPHAHGPTTLNYMTYGTGINLSDVKAGDLIVSVEHIGIAISSTQMISAQDKQSGTGIAGFPGGFPSGPPLYRRVNF